MRLFFLLFLACLTSFNAFSKDKINLLTWWGYIDQEDILDIQSRCDVELSVDEYYSNTEFLRRWDDKKQSHDLIIYSNTIYGLIKNLLAKNVKDPQFPPYDKRLTNTINKLSLNGDTRIFLMSLSGFLMPGKDDPSLKAETPVEYLLKDSVKRIFVIMDDSVEGIGLLQKMNLLSLQLKEFSSEKISTNTSKFIITNDIENLITDKNFSLAYAWSGGAIKTLDSSKNRNLRFQIFPELAHLTADLISFISKSKASKCTFDYISGKDFLDKKQNATYYFSPYGGNPSSKEPRFLNFHKKYFHQLSSFRWLESPNLTEFYQQDEYWKKLKIFVNNK